MGYCSNAKRESPHSDNSTRTALQFKNVLVWIFSRCFMLQCMFFFKVFKFSGLWVFFNIFSQLQLFFNSYNPTKSQLAMQNKRRDFDHSHLHWAKLCSTFSAMFGQAFRCSSQAWAAWAAWDTVLLWFERIMGPNPTDSSSTNHLKYANSAGPGNKKKQEVVMMSFCVLSSSTVWMWITWVLFSVVIRDVSQHACMLVKSAQSH